MIALSLLVLVMVGGVKASAAETTRNFVLVHGAWVGEWYWEPLTTRLRDKGHNVYVVSLTGHGMRSSDSEPGITVSDHAQDILDVIEENDLDDVYLVSHSYGGKPATAAWDLARPRIRHVVYIDAPAPLGDGPQVIAGQPKLMAFLEKNFPDIAASGLMPVRPQMRQELKDRAMPQSLSTLIDPVVLRNGPLPDETLRTYVVASENEAQHFKRLAGQLRADPRWMVVELKSGHDIMLDAPDLLAMLLEKLE